MIEAKNNILDHTIEEKLKKPFELISNLFKVEKLILKLKNH